MEISFLSSGSAMAVKLRDCCCLLCASSRWRDSQGYRSWGLRLCCSSLKGEKVLRTRRCLLGSSLSADWGWLRDLMMAKICVGGMGFLKEEPLLLHSCCACCLGRRLNAALSLHSIRQAVATQKRLSWFSCLCRWHRKLFLNWCQRYQAWLKIVHALEDRYFCETDLRKLKLKFVY